MFLQSLKVNKCNKLATFLVQILWHKLRKLSCVTTVTGYTSFFFDVNITTDVCYSRLPLYDSYPGFPSISPSLQVVHRDKYLRMTRSQIMFPWTLCFCLGSFLCFLPYPQSQTVSDQSRISSVINENYLFLNHIYQYNSSTFPFLSWDSIVSL